MSCAAFACFVVLPKLFGLKEGAGQPESLHTQSRESKYQVSQQNSGSKSQIPIMESGSRNLRYPKIQLRLLVWNPKYPVSGYCGPLGYRDSESPCPTPFSMSTNSCSGVRASKVSIERGANNWNTVWERLGCCLGS